MELAVPLHIVRELDSLLEGPIIERHCDELESMCLTELHQNDWMQTYGNIGNTSFSAYYRRKRSSCFLYRDTKFNQGEFAYFRLEARKKKWIMCFTNKRLQYKHKNKVSGWSEWSYRAWKESLLKELRVGRSRIKK